MQYTSASAPIHFPSPTVVTSATAAAVQFTMLSRLVIVLLLSVLVLATQVSAADVQTAGAKVDISADSNAAAKAEVEALVKRHHDEVDSLAHSALQTEVENEATDQLADSLEEQIRAAHEAEEQLGVDEAADHAIAEGAAEARQQYAAVTDNLLEVEAAAADAAEDADQFDTETEADADVDVDAEDELDSDLDSDMDDEGEADADVDSEDEVDIDSDSDSAEPLFIEHVSEVAPHLADDNDFDESHNFMEVDSEVDAGDSELNQEDELDLFSDHDHHHEQSFDDAATVLVEETASEGHLQFPDFQSEAPAPNAVLKPVTILPN